MDDLLCNQNYEIDSKEDGVTIFKAGKYTIEFKKKAVALARLLNNNSKAARDLNLKYKLHLTKSSLRDWRKEIESEKDEKQNRKKMIILLKL